MAFKATDYLITPRDIVLLFLALFRLSLLSWVKVIVLIAAFFVATHFGVGTVDAIFLLFFVAVFLFNIEARVPISLALLFLIAIVLIMLLGPYVEYVNETTWPETIAVWVYYLLATGVLKQMKDLFVSRGEHDEDDEEGRAAGAVRSDYLEANFLEHVDREDAKASDEARRIYTPTPLLVPASRTEDVQEEEAPRGLIAVTPNAVQNPRYRVVKKGKVLVIHQISENTL